MEVSWENWDLHMEMDCDDDDEFLREILLQPPAFSSESESDHRPFHASYSAAAEGGVLSSEGMEQSKSGSNSKRPRRSSSPKTFILSFDKGSMIPATLEPCLNYDQFLGTHQGKRSPKNLFSSKRTLDEPKAMPNHGAKKHRSSSQTIDHIMAERKRRQELTERFIALSAIIPGLSKTDKASVLRAAIDYVKQLKERVEELEKHDKKRGVETVTVIKKTDVSGNEYPTTSETSCDNCSNLPEIEARMLGKEVLIEIHCEKQNGIELKIMDHLENLHLSVTGSSVFPFGNSALSFTIIAQIGEVYKMTVNDLVKSLRQLLLKSQLPSQSDPY